VGEGGREEGAGRREEGPSPISDSDHVSRGGGAAPCRGSDLIRVHFN
jgi:hypothetical protein